MLELPQITRIAMSLLAVEPFETATRLLLTVYEMVGAALGLFIAYQAYRGYRRNDSRPMLYISLGFILIFGLPSLLVGVVLLLPTISQPTLQVVIQTFEIAGLLGIIYALWMNP